MADFHQAGPIATLHRLRRDRAATLTSELVEHAARRPIGLVLPCLADELNEPGLAQLVGALRDVPYLGQVVVSVSARDREALLDVAGVFDSVRTSDGKPVAVLWANGPAIGTLGSLLRKAGLGLGGDGKGRAVWLAYGYLLAMRRVEVVALHDCDIRNYTPELLARLVYPIVHPALRYRFAKGFYARVGERMYGRVTRLLVAPLLGALETVLGPHPLLTFLRACRYPLAGECAMDLELIEDAPIPNDWGLEISTLAEMYRAVRAEDVCQVELADNYEHRHRELSPDDPTTGLHRMAIDIAGALIRNLRGEGVPVDEQHLDAVRKAYEEAARHAIARYRDDAVLNALQFDEEEERRAAATFSKALRAAARVAVDDPRGAPSLPSWNRVATAAPGALDVLYDAVIHGHPPRPTRASARQSERGCSSALGSL